MSQRLAVKFRDALQVFQSQGFSIVRQHGSHVVLQKRVEGGGTRTLVVPKHPELAAGTMRSILRKAGLTTDDFLRLL